MMAITPQIVDFSSNSHLPRENETPNVLSSLSAWKAFQSGMQVLQRYANRSPVDIHTIAKSNIQLLHRSLSYNTQYIDNIENIRHESTESDLPTLRRLYSDQGLTADLLSLQDGASINLVARPQRYAMYLLISGSAQLGPDDESTRLAPRWWNRVVLNKRKNYLRNGAVVIRSNQQTDNCLTAKGKDCLILRVHTPAEEIFCKIAS